jgi:hypothetical protein
MGKKAKFIMFLFLSCMLLLGCRDQVRDWRYSPDWPYLKERPDWPNNVITSFWVPQGAQDLRYYTRPENYQIICDVKICFPANNLIEEMINDMTAKGWKRLEFDHLNPWIKLHHARPYEGLALKWGRFSTQDGNIIFQWIEDWEDSQKNVIRYALMYRSKKIVPAEMCDLYVVSIYSTAEAIRKLNEALRELNLRKEER